jgi:hypothetical protein
MKLKCPHCDEWQNFDNNQAKSAHFRVCSANQSLKQKYKKHLSKNKEQGEASNFNEFMQDESDSDNDDPIRQNQEKYQFRAVNTKLLDEQQIHDAKDMDQAYGRENTEYHSSVELMELIRKYKIPNNAFDDFIKWHSKAVATEVNFNSGPKPTREKVLQDIDKHFDMSALTPKNSNTNC